MNSSEIYILLLLNFPVQIIKPDSYSHTHCFFPGLGVPSIYAVLCLITLFVSQSKLFCQILSVFVVVHSDCIFNYSTNNHYHLVQSSL